ncbi:hypothetical protein SAMN05444166_5751 [Singulisphaera sp. GP187]|nr:hypothetical protein [Singulisphaera sp. GP187]SIO58629.1 hypothetical protein SAMN05444166_5751 [Singulisphaera sp. GP187]
MLDFGFIDWDDMSGNLQHIAAALTVDEPDRPPGEDRDRPATLSKIENG